jgi:hypothetical protein
MTLRNVSGRSQTASYRLAFIFDYTIPRIVSRAGFLFFYPYIAFRYPFPLLPAVPLLYYYQILTPEAS